MIDQKKVIRGLEICSELGSWHGLNCEDTKAYKDCPYRGCETGCVVTIAKDAIALLKEQEPVKPDYNPYYQEWYCGNCGKMIPKAYNYCNYCGKAVKWE